MPARTDRPRVNDLVHITSGSNPADRLAGLRATTRALTFRYLFALSLIAALAGGGFLILQEAIRTHEASSSIINMSARQGTLIQQAAATARHLIESSDPSAQATHRGRLFETAHAIERAHRRLTDPSDTLGRPLATSEAVRALYFDGPLHLDRKIQSFVDDAIWLSGAPQEAIDAEHPSFRQVVGAAASLLPCRSTLWSASSRPMPEPAYAGAGCSRSPSWRPPS